MTECDVKFQVLSHRNQIDEYQYLDALKDVFETGTKIVSRNGTTLSKFGMRMEFNLDRFPLLTTKKMGYKTILKELIWFLKGQTDNSILNKQGVRIWDGNSTREFLESRGLDYMEGDLGPIYGFQWRHFGANYHGKHGSYVDCGYDQLKWLIKEIKENPS